MEDYKTDNDFWKKNNEAFLLRYHNSLDKFVLRQDTERANNAKEFKNEKADYYQIFSYSDTSLLKFILGFEDIERVVQLYSDRRAAARFVFYIPEATTFLKICTEMDLSTIISDSRVYIFVGEYSEEKLLREIGDILTLEYVNNMSYVVLYEKSRCIQEERAFRDTIWHIYMQREIEKKTYQYYGTLPCINELYALSVLHKNHVVSMFIEKIPDRNMPIILVGAGPSLQNNVKELIKAKKKSLIVCASHAVRVMQNEGIRPDLIAEIESRYWPFCNEIDRDNHILISSRASIEDQKYFEGNCVYFSFDQNIFPCQEIIKEMVLTDNSGSVMTEVFELFVKYGFKKFIFVGQDLAYSEEGYTHANAEYQEEPAGTKRVYVQGKKRALVESRYDWIRYREYYEKQLELHPEIVILDATDGGALIKGTKICSLSTAIDEFCEKEYPITEIIKSLPKAQTQEEKKELRTEMLKRKEELDMIALQIPRAIMDNQKLQELVENGQNNTGIFSWIATQYDEKYHQILDSDVSKLLLFYSEGMLQEYLERKLEVEEKNRIKEKLKLEKDLFQILNKSIIELSDYIKETWTA